MRRRIACVTLAMVLCLMPVVQSVLACPFCLSPPQTFAEQMERADIVLIAELVRFRVLDFGTRAESTLRIREYLRGAEFAVVNPKLAVGQCITTDSDYSAKRGDLFLMYGDLPVPGATEPASTFTSSDTADDADSAEPSPIRPVSVSSIVTPRPAAASAFRLAHPWLIDWNDTTAVSPAVVDYLRRLPARTLPKAERLKFYLPYLEHADPALAIDAWAEFANSSYEDVVAVRSLMPRADLQRWISDPLCSPDRLGLYGMMLGLCGTEADAAFLREQMLDAETGSLRFGSDGLMGGYLLLAKERALDDLDGLAAAPTTTDTNAMYAYAQALSFLQSYEPDRVPAARLRRSMRLFLEHESMREIAITHLARWQDWDVLPRLVEMYDRDCADDAMTRRSIVQFAEVCVSSSTAVPVAAASADLREQAMAFLAKANPPRP